MTDLDTMTPAEFKAWENRMRRRLAVQGLTLRRSRTRLTMATDYGLYDVSDANNVSMTSGYTLNPAAVEEWAKAG